jgi:hypothetical protein
MFIVPMLNIVLALKAYLALTVVVLIESIYAAYKEKRWDMLLVPVYYPVMMYINCWISLEQFVKEGLMRRKELSWFHPARRAI